MGTPGTKLEVETGLAKDFLNRFELDAEPRSFPSFFRDFVRDPSLSWFQQAPAPERTLRAQIRAGVFRALDLVLSSFFLLLSSPLIIFLIIAIRIESPGPAIFIQKRMGKNGRTFPMFKLRSMRFQKKEEPLSLTRKDDLRVTRIGRFTRNHHFDELLQFINVLKGEMSLVGPRPEMPAIAEFSALHIPNYDFRNRVLPGITGLAQILCGYGQNLGDLRRTTALDIYSIEHRSVRNYFLILLKTVTVVMRGSEFA